MRGENCKQIEGNKIKVSIQQQKLKKDTGKSTI